MKSWRLTSYRFLKITAIKLEIYTVSQKKTVPTYLLLHVCRIWTDFSKKFEGSSRNEPLTKLCLKCPLHLTYVLTLPWEILGVRLSHQHNNYVYIWMINRITTNTTDSYCLSKKVTRVTSHHLYYSMYSKCPPSARMQAADADATRQQHVL